MRVTTRAPVAIVAAVTALYCSAPVSADPVTDPCQLAVTFLCKFMPVAPDLDHDVDLTQSPATINGRPVPQLPALNPGTTEAVQPPSS
jgi:hypothetical protein